MDYHLSEDEFNSLESSADQIDLLTNLCAFIPKGQHAITIAGLESFLCAQQEVLRTTLKALAERQEAQRKSEHHAMATERCNRAPLAISLDLLLRIMDACSGAVQDDEAIIQIHSDLYDATVMRGHGAPLKAFHAALHRQGLGINFTMGNGVAQTSIKRVTPKESPQPAKSPRVATRKRDRLVAA